jgi:hypothetical protein
MIPAKLIVIVLAMFVIASFGAITPTVLAAQHERQQQEQGQQQPPAQAQTNNTTANDTTALSSQSPPQPSCPVNTFPGTMSVPSYNIPTNADICVELSTWPSGNDGQCPEGFTLSNLTFPPQCQTAVWSWPNCPEGYSWDPQTNECSQHTQTQTQPLR